MSDSKKQDQPSSEKLAEKPVKAGGNMVYMTVGILIVAAVVALAFVSNTVITKKENDGDKQELIGEEFAQTQTASGTEAPADVEEISETETIVAEPEDTPKEMPAAEPEMKEGNPVVATLGAEKITRDDVAKFIAQLPVQMRQQPFEVLFPIALEQTINAKILEREADRSGIAKEPQVEEMVADAAKNIVRTAYVQKLIDDGVTEDAIKAEYDKYVANFKGEEETHARHILVATEDEAKEIIQKLADGAAFEALAKEYSTGPSGPNGGDLGYFAKEQMVPEFSEAAFALKIGDYTKEPVKTQFGYHVIKAEDRRESKPATLEEARPYIEAELKRNYLDDKLQSWRQTLDIKTFDINGEPLKQETTSPAAAAAGHQG